MSFSKEEKSRAHAITYNVGTVIHGNVSQSQVAPMDSKQSNTNNAIDSESIRSLIAALRQNRVALKLQQQTEAELKAEIHTLEAQSDSPNPKTSIVRECLSSVRSILENTAGSVAAVAILKEFPKLFGG